MGRIQSKKHKTRTYENNKISLSCFDDKKICFRWHLDECEKQDVLKDDQK